MNKSFVILLLILLGALPCAPTYARTLHVGNQSIPLTADKRSAPALAVRIDDTTWYGFLAAGTAPGRLTVQMPGGQIHSLIPPTSHNVTDILADYPQIYTWNGSEHGLPNSYNGTSVYLFGSTADNANLTNAGIYPTYWVQSICSNTAGAYLDRGNPVHAGNGTRCWCRLKRRIEGANGGWVFWSNSSPTDCAHYCPASCAHYAGIIPEFRAALFDAFENP